MRTYISMKYDFKELYEKGSKLGVRTEKAKNEKCLLWVSASIC